MPSVQQRQLSGKPVARHTSLACPAAPRRQPARTFRQYRMADRSRTASRAQARQTLVQTTSIHHSARKRADYRRGHCRCRDRAQAGGTRRARYRFGSGQSGARAALRQNLAARHRADRTATGRLRLHPPPTARPVARFRRMGRRRRVAPQFRRSRTQAQSGIGFATTSRPPLP